MHRQTMPHVLDGWSSIGTCLPKPLRISCLSGSVPIILLQLQQATEAKLSSQEVFWSAKFKSLLREHAEEMGRVRAEAELMKSAAESAREELEREILARHEVAGLTVVIL